MRKMTFQDEHDFEGYIRGLIATHITSTDKNIYALTNKKAVDIVICKDNEPTDLYFIEVKYHKHRHGRLGFGGSKGTGYQPEILDRRPKFFQKNMRWVIGQEDNDKIYFLTNDDLINYIAGGQIGEKFNNIQKRVFQDEQGLTEDEFVSELTKWLKKER